MSHAAKHRASGRRKQPYAWLRVGAVTLGMGAAMVGGTAVCFADTGNAGNDSAGSSEKAGNDTATDSPAKAAARGNAAAEAHGAGDESSDAARRGRPAVVETPETTTPATAKATIADLTTPPKADLETPPKTDVETPPKTELETPPKTELETPPTAQSQTPLTPSAVVTPKPVTETASHARNSPLPAAAVSPAGVHDSAPVVKALAKPGSASAVDTSPVIPVVSPAADTAPDVARVLAAATPAPAAAVAPSNKSWLPSTPIVAGASVKLAVQQIEQAQSLLSAATWGSGNIFAGIGSLGPTSALATAQLALAIWGASIAGAQDFVKNTAGNPLVHWIAQANLQSQLMWPKISDASLATANALMAPLSWVGADVSGAQAKTVAARENGKIYALVPLRIVAGIEPVVDGKIAGGSKAALLVDTGASGLVITRDKIGPDSLGPIVGVGNSCFSGNLCYHYQTYNATVDLGDGAVGTAPINIVTDNVTYPNSEAGFKKFLSWGADGILGVGANAAGPGPSPIPTAAMPGELKNGVLIYQNAYPFGLGGYMILGPNLFPTKVSLPGTPNAFVNLSINGSTETTRGAIIDSGGVYGTILRSDIPAGVTPEKINGVDYLPAGVKISVYAPGTTTLLYSYTTEREGTSVINSGLFNTGNAPYAQNPIYLNYATTPYGIGSTDFSIA
jgi:hypothetical protein